MPLAEGEQQNDENELARVIRYANRVPLLYQQSACSTFKAVLDTTWRNYGIPQSRGALPAGPMVIFVHIASVWVPFTSESKEAIADYDEIRKEIKLALQECGRRLGVFFAGASGPEASSAGAIFLNSISKKSSKPVIVSRAENCPGKNSKSNCKRSPSNAPAAKKPTKCWDRTAAVQKVFPSRSLSPLKGRKAMRR